MQSNKTTYMHLLHFSGIIIAICSFLIIGIFHPIVIKAEYYTGQKLIPLFIILGIGVIIAALFVADTLCSALLGGVGASLLWSVGEIKDQRKRVKKGWFPMNPKRKKEYED